MSEEKAPKAPTDYVAFAEDGSPRLQGSRCESCNAVFLGPRENCARCAKRGGMEPMVLGNKGRLYNYTIVYRSFPGVTVPFVAAVVDLDGGGSIQGNLLDIEPSPDAIAFDMPVEVVFRDAGAATEAGAGYVSHFFVPARQEAA